MSKRKKYFFLFITSVLLINSLFLHNVSAYEEVNSPIIIDVIQNEVGNFTKPLIIGLTQSGTEVMIYINEQYIGLAEINQKNTGTDNFYFQHTKPLKPGQHTIKAIAKDKTSLVLSSASKEIEFYIVPLPSPTLIAPDNNTITGKIKPAVTGLTTSDSFVHIYIDGVYNGKTKNLSHKSNVANFAYKPFLNLSVGEHTAWAIAEDESGRKSQVSNILKFKIEEPTPAPILYIPVVNDQTAYNRPFVVGLAKNNLLVKIYVDRQFNGEFKVKNNETGVANFSYKPFLPLTTGAHLLYTEAINERGKVSIWSNIIYFNIVRPVQPAITAEAVEETKEVKKIEVLSEVLEIEEIQPTEEKIQPIKGEDEDTDDDKIKDIEKFLQQEENKTTEKTGLINESKERQSKLQLNLIIFILFLIAVIAWILWVNRELIKEQRAQNKNKNKDSLTDSEQSGKDDYDNKLGR